MTLHDLILALVFILPLAFLLHVLWAYLRWKSHADPGETFATGYWYTEKNPFHRSWWPIFAIVIYMAIVALAGIFVGD